MTYEEFLEKLSGAGVIDQGATEISTHWRTGGMTGGSCWGSRADMPVPAEKEPEFEKLDEILELVCPHMGFVQYRRVCQRVIELDENPSGYGGGDYYGNYYTYAEKKVKLHNLFLALQERELL
jgi:hypothetical protein